MAATAVAVVGNTSAPASADKIGVSGEGVGSEAAVGTWRMRAVGDGCGGCDRCDRRGDHSSRRRAAANAGGQAQRAPSVSPGAEAGYGILKAGRLGDVLDDLRQRGTAVEECRKAVAYLAERCDRIGIRSLGQNRRSVPAAHRHVYKQRLQRIRLGHVGIARQATHRSTRRRWIMIRSLGRGTTSMAESPPRSSPTAEALLSPRPQAARPMPPSGVRQGASLHHDGLGGSSSLEIHRGQTACFCVHPAASDLA